MHKNKRLFHLYVITLAFALWLPAANAGDPQGTNSGGQQQARVDIPRDVENQYDRAQNAADILDSLTNTPDQGIPTYLLDRAHGIAVFPHVIKGAFVVGGRWGKGLVSVRQNGKWTAPVFVDLSGGSFGFQFGGQTTDLVLVFTDRKGLDSLLNSKLKLGADASAAAGPVGRTAEASTDLYLNASIYSYSRSKGLFAGIALDGAVVSMDDSANRKVYSRKGKEIFGSATASSPVTMPFQSALRATTPAKIK